MRPRHYLRLAQKMLTLWEHQCQTQFLRRPNYLQEITKQCDDLGRAEQRWQMALALGLRLILPRLDEERQFHFVRLQQLLNGMKPFAHTRSGTLRLRDLVNELQQLDAEFGDLTIDWKQHRLAVTTELIQLQDVELGSFSIRLRWDDWAKQPCSSCFEIVALNPHPAGSNADVTHPHVNQEELCAGDAAAPIRQALTSGRVAEAFLLVHSVLTTYNSRSAHVPLSEWDGTLCADCGESVNSSETYSCCGCEADYCDSCSTCCEVCGSTRCFGCSVRCAECDVSCCPACLLTVGSTDQECCTQCAVTCPQCAEVVLRSDFDGEAERCQSCLSESISAVPSSASSTNSEESIYATSVATP